MNINLVKRFMNIVQKHSPSCFINNNFELIVEPKNDIYFRIEDVDSELTLKCKVLAWLSRPSCKGVSEYWQKRIRAIINDYLGTNFTEPDMRVIYTYLGNDCNRKRTELFIQSGYDLSILSNQAREGA